MKKFYKKSKIEQLEAFCLVFETKSIIKTAKIMRISSSSVTMYIKSLENNLSLELFSRNNLRLKPNDVAEKLYQNAKNIVNNINYIYNEFIEAIKNENKILRIACHTLMYNVFIKEIINKFKTKYKSVQFYTLEINNNDAFYLMLQNKIDIMIYPFKNENLDALKHLDCRFIKKYEATIFAPLDHKIKKIPLEFLTVEKIIEHNFIIPNNVSHLSNIDNVWDIACSYQDIAQSIIEHNAITVTDRLFELSISKNLKDKIEIIDISSYIHKDINFYFISRISTSIVDQLYSIIDQDLKALNYH